MGEKGDYFAKCNEIISQGDRHLDTFCQDLAAEKTNVSAVDFKFQMCFHYALYEMLKDYVDAEKTYCSKVDWARGLSMIRIKELGDQTAKFGLCAKTGLGTNAAVGLLGAAAGVLGCYALSPSRKEESVLRGMTTKKALIA